ncbi:hypothetical protein QRO11_14535 [Paracidovorax citrulli]|uniref:Carbohydrate ABC transporter permease n=2 Tax=Paracidovorax citrulli TaxID=80869 RepID=A0ABY9AJT4_PARCI|nr:hypothetical protein [Paracidovorax citrulli]PVY63391.1 hypothetical protein C8E08_0675 [Paracidovorax citrulli]QCX12327.1 hypothetical protein APS58_3586 [Paracidovorax citrulli]REG67642.1 hypothetical protein C8E07_0714 [Paracidovorax citrulli]RLJ92202.1 hypothetical protein C8E06_0715 [Paracidovorax citrulli]WIY32213.1 hypothetical protein QRO09_11010 [Paracidovorax citrulli]
MNAPRNSAGAVPTSSNRNRFASARTLWVAGIALAVILFVFMIPW